MARINETMRRVAAQDLSDQERQALRRWDQAYPSFLAARQQVIAMVDLGHVDEATPLRNSDGNNSLAPAATSLKDLQGLQSDSAAGKRNDVLASGVFSRAGVGCR